MTYKRTQEYGSADRNRVVYLKIVLSGRHAAPNGTMTLEIVTGECEVLACACGATVRNGRPRSLPDSFVATGEFVSDGRGGCERRQ